MFKNYGRKDYKNMINYNIEIKNNFPVKRNEKDLEFIKKSYPTLSKKEQLQLCINKCNLDEDTKDYYEFLIHKYNKEEYEQLQKLFKQFSHIRL